MNAALRLPLLPDIQSLPDARALPIEAVGIRRLRCPVRICAAGREQPTVATFSMSVALPAAARGTHMSRFIELLEARAGALDAAGFRSLVVEMLARLGAATGEIEMSFPLFIAKRAPVSGAEALVDYEASWRGSVAPGGACGFAMKVAVPVTSLCPCSKEISDYGAHNQRSIVSIDAGIDGPMDIGELIAIAERAASCEVYGLLKRADEKFVTERAYENPKFAEDLVRDAALELNRDRRVLRYTVEAENFESIHNHSAYARITGPAGVAA